MNDNQNVQLTSEEAAKFYKYLEIKKSTLKDGDDLILNDGTIVRHFTITKNQHIRDFIGEIQLELLSKANVFDIVNVISDLK